MKAAFQFELPEENDEYDMYRKAGLYRNALQDIDDFCRTKIKHSEISEETFDLLTKIRIMIPNDL